MVKFYLFSVIYWLDGCCLLWWKTTLNQTRNKRCCMRVYGCLIRLQSMCRQEAMLNLSLALWLYQHFIFFKENKRFYQQFCKIKKFLSIWFPNIWFIHNNRFGISIHFKIYPIIYSLAIYLSLSESNEKLTFSNFFSWRRVRYALITIITFATLTGTLYWIYGMPFLHETYLYHVGRQVTKKKTNFTK